MVNDGETILRVESDICENAPTCYRISAPPSLKQKRVNIKMKTVVLVCYFSRRVTVLG